MKEINLGTHYLADFFECSNECISSKHLIREAMLQAARIAGATIVADVFHEFNPHGVSGVVVIAESHIAIHTWPEFNCASVDIFTCGSHMDSESAIHFLQDFFKSSKVEIKKIKRANAND